MSKVSNFFKKALIKILKNHDPLIPNKILKLIPITILEKISDDTLKTIPIRGIVKNQLSNGKSLLMKSDGNDRIASLCFFKGIYGFEKETITLFEKLLNNCKVFLDIGANIGFYSLFAALNDTDETIKIYAFEPVPVVFSRLKDNIQLNKISNIQPINTAINNYDGLVNLLIKQHDLSMPTLSRITSSSNQKSLETITVKSLKIDTFVTRNDICQVDLIKIDIEGAEAKAIEGAKDVIQRDKPIIICEIGGKNRAKNIQQQISETVSYLCFLITDKGLIPIDKITNPSLRKYYNYLLVPKDKVSIINEIALVL
ncbi:MAG: FkbM family methyltransferase [Crocosphaera sp.]